MSEVIPKHNVKVDDIIPADDPDKFIALFPGKKPGEFFAKSYKRDGEQVLVTDQEYTGSGLIIFVGNVEKTGKSIKIKKVLPNVLFGDFA